MSKEIKSVSHFKKILKVGDKVAITYHLKPNGVNHLGEGLYRYEVRPVRTVHSRNTNSFVLLTKEENWEHGRMVVFPKASMSKVVDGALVVFGEDLDNPENKTPVKWMTIRIV